MASAVQHATKGLAYVQTRWLLLIQLIEIDECRFELALDSHACWSADPSSLAVH